MSYMKEMRNILLEKYDNISAHILEYIGINILDIILNIEKYTIYT